MAYENGNAHRRRDRARLLLATVLAMTGAPAQAQTVTGRSRLNYDAVIDAAREARFVLLGESTHGTGEFYSERARVTLPLLDDPQTGAVVIEADGTEVERVNRYVRGFGSDRSADEALADFRRFPRWMWRNVEFAAFVEQLRAANLQRPEAARVGLYGMDVYDLYGALDRVRAYVRGHVPAATAAAGAAARCFAPYRRSTEAYGIASRKQARWCVAPANALLEAVVRAPAPAEVTTEERFAATQAATAVVAGEAYFRAAFAGAYSWNVRERSMAAVIRRVAAHVGSARAGVARVVVWTHNNHLAHAASTDMADRGEVSIADLLRQDASAGVFTVGFLTHSGSFMAAPAWDRPGQVYRLAPAAQNSVEGLLGRSGEDRAVLMPGEGAAAQAFADWRPQRSVGVVFDPASPGAGYARARLATEFDAVVFLSQTGAVTPLAR